MNLSILITMLRAKQYISQLEFLAQKEMGAFGNSE
jgi:hypothetical protein